MEGERKEKFQTEGSLRETLRNYREEREMYSQHELKEKSTCPAEAEGLGQSLLQNLKAVSSWNELKPRRQYQQSGRVSQASFSFCSILTVCNTETMLYSTRAE